MTLLSVKPIQNYNFTENIIRNGLYLMQLTRYMLYTKPNYMERHLYSISNIKCVEAASVSSSIKEQQITLDQYKIEEDEFITKALGSEKKTKEQTYEELFLRLKYNLSKLSEYDSKDIGENDKSINVSATFRVVYKILECFEDNCMYYCSSVFEKVSLLNHINEILNNLYFIGKSESTDVAKFAGYIKNLRSLIESVEYLKENFYEKDTNALEKRILKFKDETSSYITVLEVQLKKILNNSNADNTFLIMSKLTVSNPFIRFNELLQMILDPKVRKKVFYSETSKINYNESHGTTKETLKKDRRADKKEYKTEPKKNITRSIGIQTETNHEPKTQDKTEKPMEENIDAQMISESHKSDQQTDKKQEKIE